MFLSETDVTVRSKQRLPTFFWLVLLYLALKKKAFGLTSTARSDLQRLSPPRSWPARAAS